MQLSVSVDLFRAALDRVYPVSRKAMLAAVRMRYVDGKLLFSSATKECHVQTWCAARLEGSLAHDSSTLDFAFDPAMLREFLKSVKASSIVLDCDKKKHHISITHGANVAKFNAHSGTETFDDPEIVEPESWTSLSCGTLAAGLRAVVPATAPDALSSNPRFQTVIVRKTPEALGTGLQFAASDGYRLHACTFPAVKMPAEFPDILVPAKSATFLAGLAAQRKADESLCVFVALEKLWIQGPEFQFVSLLVDTPMYDIDPHVRLPESRCEIVTLRTDVLQAARFLNPVLAAIREGVSSVGLYFHPEQIELITGGSAYEDHRAEAPASCSIRRGSLGSVTEMVKIEPPENDGACTADLEPSHTERQPRKQHPLMLKAKYFQQALAAMFGETVMFAYSGPLSALHLVCEDEARQVVCVIMPLSNSNYYEPRIVYPDWEAESEQLEAEAEVA